ncbi:hypothetical protein T12_14307 [Trichinella patagoniensis]|uniref:Uncharacterized protein n=1 Tax=Trichinella patagoniensis TaxID=990121 RepID=A0A0V0Z864_9BILA|nr:hypothetical protein T12_14307 [Trichinella patagoniensis]
MVSPSISCNAESVRQERRNSLDLPLWGFHLAMRAFGDCLWPADCSAFDGVRISCSSGGELLEAVEPVFHDSFFRIKDWDIWRREKGFFRMFCVVYGSYLLPDI